MHLDPGQCFGAAFLARRRVAYLADVMGIGKTAQFIRACDHIAPRAVTVLCPAILRENIKREFDRWSLAGYDVALIETGKDPVPPAGVVICSYSLASADKMRNALRNRRAEVLILDEAHATKNRRSERTKAIFNADGIAKHARHVWFVSGTPAPNNASELFVFLRAAGVWSGTWMQFVDRYCVTHDNGFGTQIIGTKNKDELKALIAPLLLRRTEVAGRPFLTVDVTTVPGTGARDAFADLSPETLEALASAAERGDWSFAETPAVATARRMCGLAKAPGVADLIRCELDGGRKKILVFAHHTDVIELIASELGDVAAILDGRTPPAKRQKIIDAFQNEDLPRVIVGQNEAAGEGSTLTAADRVLVVEPPWTPSKIAQIIARAWRRGQTRHVHASIVSLAGSIDEQISRVLKRKTADLRDLL